MLITGDLRIARERKEWDSDYTGLWSEWEVRH